MKEIMRKNLSDEVYDVLKKMIVSGELKPGEKLPEEELTKKLGVSRTPIREAISALAQDNLIDVIPRRGAFVNQLSEQDITEIYDIRMVLEGLAVRLSIPHLSEADLEKMTRLLEQAEAALLENPEYAINADLMLHDMIVKNCGNLRLQKIIVDLRDQVHSFRIQEGHQLEIVPKVMKERWDILNAIKDCDPDRAEKAVIHHIAGVKERRLAQISDES
jgi:DNA-binding GntR family transcriptional regulator